MAAQTETEDEPSIEEILDSIRQIISDDDEEEAAATAESDRTAVDASPAEETKSGESQVTEDIIELTEPVEDDIPVEEEKPSEEPADDEFAMLSELAEQTEEETGPEVVDIGEFAEPEQEPETTPEPQAKQPEPEAEPAPEPAKAAPAPEPAAKPVSEPAATSGEEGSLLTDKAENAAMGAFAELAKKSAVGHDGITIEEIVRQELRPLLKEWLDKHLPVLIERLVQDELERVAKRARED